MPTFHLAFKCEPLTHGDAAIREEMVADLAAEALFGESSELYLRLYEEGIIDSSFGGGFETVDGCAMLLCSGDSDDPPRRPGSDSGAGGEDRGGGTAGKGVPADEAQCPRPSYPGTGQL